VHALEVATFQKDRQLSTEALVRLGLEVARTLAAIPAQAAMLLFALRRRFQRQGQLRVATVATP
jgi:hypothetical protein